MDNSQVVRQLAQDAIDLIGKTNLVPPVSLDELLMLAENLVNRKPQYQGLSNWAVLMLNNALWRDIVASVPFHRKLLLIPQCLKHETCPAQIDELGLLCESCGACEISGILDFAEGLGMMCMVAEGSTMVAQLVEEGKVDAIIGVSCFDALQKAFQPMIDHAVPGMALPLYGEGCKNTATDLEFLKNIVEYRSDARHVLQPIKPLLNEVRKWFAEESLDEILGKPCGESEKIARSWLVVDGKRYRPFLCVATAVSLGLDSINDPSLKKLAVAVECFHKASLVHDDIEDNDERRYDRPTLHLQHGIPIALNTGDLLLGEGYRMISDLPLPNDQKTALLQIAVEGHLELCRGQGEELLHCHRNRPFKPAELVDVFRQKTAPAFDVAFQFGATLMNAEKEEKAVLRRFSENLGIAYQIIDDLHDAREAPAGTCNPSIVNAFMDEEGIFYEEALEKSRTLFERHKKKALLALRPLRNFHLKRLLFQVAHSIVGDIPTTPIVDHSSFVQPHSVEIMQRIRRAPGNLAPASRLKIREYIEKQLAETGGFLNRAGQPDIYYTLFGLSCAYALNVELPIDRTIVWLQQFEPSRLTLVELSSLAKSLSVFAMWQDPKPLQQATHALLSSVARFRTDDGGFSYDGGGSGFPYAAFLAMNLYQDVGRTLPEPDRLSAALLTCQKNDGRFANPDSSSSGMLLSTVAGMLTLRQLTQKIDPMALAWVKSQFTPSGGFKADPGSELPDMLSTAVALFALRVCGADMRPYRKPARRFVEDHWLENGSFSATLLDEIGDCEYSYYGLLSLGVLSDD